MVTTVSCLTPCKRRRQDSSSVVSGHHAAKPPRSVGEWGYYSDDDTGFFANDPNGGGTGNTNGEARVFQTLLTQRHYDSYSAKFLARDPIGYGGGLNLYGYAGGNPITNFDPSGLLSTLDKWQIGLTGAGFIPAVGEFADLGGIGVSIAQGDWAGAGLSTIGLVPGFGDIALAAKGARIARRVATLAREGRGAARVARDADEAANGGEDIVRLRHYTNISSKNKIQEQGIIQAGEHNRVYVEIANRKPLSPQEAESTHLLKQGHGRAYIEFDAKTGEVEHVRNPLTGVQEPTIKGNVELGQRNAEFVQR